MTPAPATSSIEVVIVNWNAGEHLRACLASIAATQGPAGRVERVTVVDNASTDDSLRDLDELPIPLRLIRNPSNVGFGAACNQGAAGSTADYLLFLNPDTRLFPDTLEIVTRFMDGEESAGVGICGAHVLEPDGSDAISCARFPSLRVMLGKMTRLDAVLPRLFPSHHLAPEETRHSRTVDQVIGAFFFVRRELFAELEGFDPRYFIYFEEVDLALRARRRGYASYFLEPARVLHVGNVSSDQVRGPRLYHSLRSRFIFAYRHWPRWQAHALVAATFTVELLARLADAGRSRRRSEVAAVASAYARLLGDLRGR